MLSATLELSRKYGCYMAPAETWLANGLLFLNQHSYDSNSGTRVFLTYTRPNMQYSVGSLLLPHGIEECISKERENPCIKATLSSSGCALNACAPQQHFIHNQPGIVLTV